MEDQLSTQPHRQYRGRGIKIPSDFARWRLEGSFFLATPRPSSGGIGSLLRASMGVGEPEVGCVCILKINFLLGPVETTASKSRHTGSNKETQGTRCSKSVDCLLSTFQRPLTLFGLYPGLFSCKREELKEWGYSTSVESEVSEYFFFPPREYDTIFFQGTL